jgi:hypothetical protein
MIDKLMIYPFKKKQSIGETLDNIQKKIHKLCSIYILTLIFYFASVSSIGIVIIYHLVPTPESFEIIKERVIWKIIMKLEINQNLMSYSGSELF